ncbi:unnamed protein product [Phytophthora lilii]|uniref:Unnamed protein product n=1 Tax=Phytophthora lilii TaxID=2077276 RepID=A0A9W6X3P9_9STRA|nr:unnamed protein product [Phytophthora lilii]
MEHRDEVVAMEAELEDLFDDFDHAGDATLSEEVLELPDLGLLLPPDDLGDDVLASLLPDEESDGNCIAAMESEEEEAGLTVSVDSPSELSPEEKEAELTEQQQDAKQEVEEEKNRLEVARVQQNMLVDAMRQHQQSMGDLHRLMIQGSPLMHYVSCVAVWETVQRCMRGEKLDVVRRFVAAQTRGIDPTREFFYVDTFERFGKFYSVDFSVSLVSGMTVAEVAEVIQDQFVVPRDGVSRLLGCVTNRTYYDGMIDTFLHARTVERVDLPERSCDGRGFLVQESNAVFYLKRFTDAEVEASDGEVGDVTVMMSDFVDVDELHPYHKNSRAVFLREAPPRAPHHQTRGGEYHLDAGATLGPSSAPLHR